MRKIAIGVAALVATVSTPALAGTATGTVDVSLTVGSACSVTAEPLSFGTVTSFDLNIDASSPSSVKCTPNASYTVALDYGVNAAATTQRKLKSTTSATFVNYSLFSDAARTSAWGGATAVTGTGTGLDQPMTIYGRVPVQTAVAAGDYKDTVTITVTY